MGNFEFHPSDEVLVQLADGELSPAATSEARRHLSACSPCEKRFKAIEHAARALREIDRFHSHTPLPPADQPRASLKSRLAKLNAGRRDFSRLPLPHRVAESVALTVAALLLIALGVSSTYRLIEHRAFPVNSSTRSAALPDKNLTPGAVRLVKVSDVCSSQITGSADSVPLDIEQTVFAKYGMPHARPQDYELDYLITPELGGATDIRNLWPEPHSSVWNSYVKDELETHLRQMVCQGKLDLPTAQHDIATDWISAYKKYFGTDQPLPAPVSKS